MGGTQSGRRLVGIGIAWLLGVAWQLNEPILPPIAAYASALGAAAALWVLAWQRPRWAGAALLGAGLAGLGVAGWHAHSRLQDSLPAAVEGRDLQLQGVVASLPQVSPLGLRFQFEVEQAQLQGEPVALPPLIALGWYQGMHEDAVLSEPQRALHAGQRWRLTARLRQPHGTLNPHGFDYELYLFEQGLRATGSVRDAPPPRLLAERAGYRIDRARQDLRDAIYASVPDARAAGVLAALALGDQSAIERDDWQLFRNTGVAHLMSISGLHITMFAWLAGALLQALWRRSRRAMLCLPAPLAGRCGGVLAATGYALFSGFGVPAQRTVWMLASVAVLRLLGRRWPWPCVLLLAAVVVSACDPWALLQPGFWLSFMAVGLLMACEPAHSNAPPSVRAPGWRGRLQGVGVALREGLRTQWIATLGLTPLTLVFFQQLSVVGFAANLLAIPVVTLGITPLALLGALAPALWSWGAQLQALLSDYLTLLARAPLATWSVPVAPHWAQAAGLLAGALAIMPLPWRLRALAVPLVLPLLLPPHAVPGEGQFGVLAVDVGQGTSVLVRTRTHLLVYDAGPQYSRDSDAGQRVLLPLLRDTGETHIDTLMLSHRDADHVGGAAALLKNLPVTLLVSSIEPEHRLRGMGVPSTRCMAGQGWAWDGVRFDVLHPQAQDYERPAKSNAMSCVLRISAAQGSILLTGDIERAQEAQLVATLGTALRSDVLLVPHHGSRTSSSADFLDAVQPAAAVIQAGYANRFGHPVAEVLARLHERKATVQVSPACGAWIWPAGESFAAAQCQRDVARRYWQAR